MDSMNDMLLVIEIADTGNFTQAGARLGMPKSTISHRVTQLEKRLGLRLFTRSTRSVSLTGNGQVYLEYCRRIRAEIAAANMAMTNLKEQPTGTLKITCPEVTATYFMPGFLGGFTKKFPRVSIELIATNQHLDLIRERVDFAFRVGSVSNQNFIVRKISTIRRVLVASPEYLAAGPPIREPSDLLQHRCLLHDALPDWTFSAETTQVVFRPPAAAKTDSLGFLLQSSLVGSGVALLPAYVCQPAIAAGRLIELLPGWELTPYDMTLVFPDRKNQSKAQAAFRDYVDACDFSHFATGRALMSSA
ncbi:MAG: LysR family transcriptional regulator [Mesorhizobium sp.]|nr:MAG: LysR family transcriptional regulator [Mesorhizobium sp.]TIM28623.1 MAG: LysR family transcriptional regulator [Mesorhizobium sp.]TIM79496.1 MAG: LysR family transcriptional regulator [Mesorhizobium sp.]